MNLVIQTKKGKVEGIATEGIRAWYGIPFGKAPVSDLRFKRAQPAGPWEGIKDCKIQGNDPIQFIGDREKEDEDCLNVNVWAPENAKNLPVMVWFYGGSFHYGYNNDPSYDGAHMAANGVIRVNVNFRLGPLGYYNFNQFDDSFDTNCTVSDQIEGLKWVRENIEGFGGNPDNITIFGESAGGTAVYNMLASPAAKGLFQKAIAQSGLPRLSGGKEYTKLIIPRFLEYVGLKPDEVCKLKTMNITKLKEAGRKFCKDFPKLYDGINPPGPFYGDDLLPEYPWTAIKNGNAEGVDAIFGYNRDEGDTFMDSSEHTTAWISSWECVEKMLQNNGRAEYFSELRTAYSDAENERKALSNFISDYYFTMDTYRCADNQLNHGKVWMYRFDFVPSALQTQNLGSTHGAEIPFALDTLDRGYFALILQGTPHEQVGAIRDQINGSWLNFAKTGNPSVEAIDWPRYEGKNSPLHVFDLQPSNQDVRINDKIFALWDKIGLPYDRSTPPPKSIY